ncbi:glycosyltransferase, group 2 family protein [Fusobacterium gonidiaformans 3-1-5R]|uniref:Glycosyltransferase, group 2 family protein n=1 Tax=Fusobacterium gonidiaformans 3-1-5R TaxID=469605 RepID=E5BE35_9FUSO|nr:glycosyltransferase [Fusobacterium gonidiaformans]EFS21311.1 glycosyltransferase, group 2 family protein [Fusobacterium gonidiaformans 3-1-5R]
MRIIDLSIVIPIYNVEKYLRECLESVYAMNLLKEVILVNDGSTDHSLQIAEEFAEKYSEETILISQENKGLSAARNVGLERARGEYIYFIDSDDFLDSKAFESFFYKIQGTDLDILHGNVFQYYEKENRIVKKNLPIKTGIRMGKEFLYQMYEEKCYREVVWLNIYRRKFLLEEKLYFVEKLLYEDTPFSFFAFWKAKKIGYEEECFYYYRFREGSIMSKPRNCLDCFYIFNILMDFIFKEKLKSEEITSHFISSVRSFAKREKIFNDEIYWKLWSLPKKNIICLRNLIDIYFRKKHLKRITLEEIIGNKQSKFLEDRK